MHNYCLSLIWTCVPLFQTCRQLPRFQYEHSDVSEISKLIRIPSLYEGLLVTLTNILGVSYSTSPHYATIAAKRLIESKGETLLRKGPGEYSRIEVSGGSNKNPSDEIGFNLVGIMQRMFLSSGSSIEQDFDKIFNGIGGITHISIFRVTRCTPPLDYERNTAILSTCRDWEPGHSW